MAQTYTGDASIDDVPPGQERLLSYAVDQDMLIDATKRDSNNDVLTGTIINGVLKLKYLDRQLQTYAMQNKSDSAKSLIIEHPRNPGFQLKTPEKALETTDSLYRFATTLAPKASGKLEVVEERTRFEQLAILPMDVTAVEYWSKNEAIPPKVQKALATAADQQRKIAQLQRQKNDADQNRTSILQEEENIRRNISTLPDSSAVRSDSIKDLAAKDAELKDTLKSIKSLQASIEKTHQDLENYLSELTIE